MKAELLLSTTGLILILLAEAGQAAIGNSRTSSSSSGGGGGNKSVKAVNKVAIVAEQHGAKNKNHSERGWTESNADRRVRKRSKWMHQQQSTSSGHHQLHQQQINKEGSLLKRIVTEVIAERDAQIAAALFEVAKNQPHLQMMVQTLGELSQSNQRLELSSTRLDETQRRLDSRLGVISEKMTLLESRVSQTERRIEREMTHIHGKMDEVFRNLPDKPTDVLLRGIKQIQDHLNVLEELMLERISPPSNNQIRSGGGGGNSHKNRHHKSASQVGISITELHKLGNSLSQAIAAVHLDLGRAVREAESNLDHQLSMLATDNGVFSCAISRLMDRLSPSVINGATPSSALQRLDDAIAEELLLQTDVSSSNTTTERRQLLEGNSIHTVDLSSVIDQLAAATGPGPGNTTSKCVLKCP